MRSRCWIRMSGWSVCGRRTVYSDFLLRYARERHLAARVDFIYELTPADLPALFRMARVFAYLPDVRSEASIVPVVEALRAGLPMVLSDTRLNREAARQCRRLRESRGAGRGRRGVGERPLRPSRGGRRCAQRERRRAELFSEYAVAERLMQIYTSL